MTLAGFKRTSFSYDGRQRDVYRQGAGPAVIVFHEIPGITPETIEFATRVASAGFEVVMPHLFGKPGRAASLPYMWGQLLHACVSREFHLLSTRRSSPVSDWLRALCRSVHGEVGGPGVGVVGMCLTGNFALTAMLEPAVLAPVVSQPALPLMAFTKERQGAIHVSKQELEEIKERAAAGVKVVGLRFSEDKICRASRFDHLRCELGEAFESIEIDSSAGNSHGIHRYAHSVLTKEFRDEEGHPTLEALERVLSFLRERLV